MSYTELQVTSNFSFLRGGSHPEELIEQAAKLGYTSIAITDRNTLAGIVRAHVASQRNNIQLIIGCRLDLCDGISLLAYPTNKEAYNRLSNLLTIGNLRTEKGQCLLYKRDVYEYREGIKFIIVPPEVLNPDFHFGPQFSECIKEYKSVLGNELYLGAVRTYQGDDLKKLYRLSQLSDRFDIPLIAANDVHYHHLDRRELQDILTCVREKSTIYSAGYKLNQNAERYLKSPEEMERLFMQYPDAIQRTAEFAEACTFSLTELKYVYPEEITSQGRTPQEELSIVTWEGAKEKFGNEIPAHIRESIEFELDFIQRKEYASYFLTVYDFVRFARENKILCQGRGSAANSTVCYCLGITSVDPAKFKLLFARFMSEDRDEPPDIDVDFEHERREEVMQYIFNKYGRDRAGVVATVNQLHFKGAIRDVGKAMGLSLDTISRLSGSVWHSYEAFDTARLIENGIDPTDPHTRKVLELTTQMMGFPRQLGQHTGGFVITHNKLSDLCPIMNARMVDRTNIEWNKDDIEALGFLKVDVLALGMLTCIRKAFDLAKTHYSLDLTLANIPQDDPDVYDMISHADTIGVFQIESRAQMSMLPRLKPQSFYDLVIEVAIVRPGPIQGDMVHPYLRRRNHEEAVDYPSSELEGILGRTLGVPLFQEQAMEIAIVAAGFSPTEADGLRRTMATFKAKGLVSQYEQKLIKGMTSRGYSEDFSKRVFRQLEGFGSYGFPESHAVSFALLVYVSSWIKCHYPDVFATALLNSLPMGFYQPAQIVADAQKHGVDVLPIDVNYSAWDNTLEDRTGRSFSIRLGFRQIKGLKYEDVETLTSFRHRFKGSGQAFKSIPSLCEADISLPVLELLADADSFRSLELDRRQALWEVAALSDRPIALFEGQPSESAQEQQISLPFMTQGEHVIRDYAATTLSLKAHPVSFLRDKLQLLHIVSATDLQHIDNGTRIKIAGLVLVRQRPGTANGVCFITIEDETGSANLVVFQKFFDQYRKVIIGSKLLMVEGKVQKEGEVIHVIVDRCYNLTPLLNKLFATENQQSFKLAYSRADERTGPAIVKKEIFDKGRNFR